MVSYPAGIVGPRRRAPRVQAERLCRRPAGAAAVGDGGPESVAAVGCARDEHAVPYAVDPEAGQRSVVDQPRARMAGDLGRGHRSGAHAQEVAGNRLAALAQPPAVEDRRDPDRAHPARPPAPPCLGRRVSGDDPDTALGDGSGFRRRVGMLAKIDDRRHLDAAVEQVERRGVPVPAGGRHDRPVARPHPVVPDQPLRRGGQHRSRQVVAAEHDGLLHRAGRHDRRLRPHLVQAASPDDGKPVVGEPSLADGAGHDLHVRRRLHRRDECAKLFLLRGAVYAEPGVGERPAGRGLVVDQQNLRSGPGGGCRGGEPGRTPADDDRVVESVFLVEPAGPGGGIDGTEARAGAEGGFPALPRAGRAVERLVIEPDRQEAGEAPDPGAPVALEAAGVVLPENLHPVLDFADGRRHVGLARQLHQRVGVPVRQGEDPAPAAVLEGARQGRDAVGGQRARDGIAREAFELPALEREADGPRAVDALSGRRRQAVLAGHGGLRPKTSEAG